MAWTAPGQQSGARNQFEGHSEQQSEARSQFGGPSPLQSALIAPTWTAFSRLPPATNHHGESISARDLSKTPLTPQPETTITERCLGLICGALYSQRYLNAQSRGLCTADIIKWAEENKKKEVEQMTPKSFKSGIQNALAKNSDGKGINLVKVRVDQNRVLYRLPASETPYTLRSPETPAGVSTGMPITAQSRKRKADDNEGTPSAVRPEEATATDSPAAGRTATRQRLDASPCHEHPPLPAHVEPAAVLSRNATAAPQRPLSICSGTSNSSDGSNGPDISDGSNRMEQVEISLTAITSTMNPSASTQQPMNAEVCHKAAQSQQPDQTEHGAHPGTNVIRSGNGGSVVEKSGISPLQQSFAELEELAKGYSSLQNAIRNHQTDFSHIGLLKKKAQALEAQAAKAREEVEYAKRSKEEAIAKAEGESESIQQRMDTICKGLVLGDNFRLQLVQDPNAKSA